MTAHAPEAYKKKLANDLQGIYSQPNAEAALVAYEALRFQYEKTCGKAMQIRVSPRKASAGDRARLERNNWAADIWSKSHDC